MKKKILIALSYVLIVALAITGTIAYLQDTDEDVNVMTLGNVHIEQIEQEWNEDQTALVDFTQAKPLYPYVGTLGWENHTTDGGAYRRFTMNNVVDKYVSVKNTGKSDAFIRTIFAFEMGEYTTVDEFRYKVIGISNNSAAGVEFPNLAWVWSDPVVTVIDGENYMLMEAIHEAPVAANETTIPSLLQVYMNSACGNEEVEKVDGNDNGTYEILVFSQAVQTNGFENAKTALDTAFGEITATNNPWADGVKLPVVVEDAEGLAEAVLNGTDVILSTDITAPLAGSAIYGTPVAVIQKNGGVIDGNGNSLDIENPQYNGYAIETYGGTIQNLTIDTAVGRGIVISSPKEDIYINNVVIDGPGYALNTTEHSAKNLVVTDSTINGWTSLAGLNSVVFEDCKLGMNTKNYWQNWGYGADFDRLVRPYGTATFTECEFEKDFYIDLSALGAGCTVTLTDCVCNGVEITANNYSDYITIELPSDRTLADCVNFA